MPPNKDQSNDGSGLQVADYWQVIRNRYGIILLSLLLVFLTAAVITYIMPEKYKASVLLEVKNVGQTKSPLGGGITAGEVAFSSNNFIQTQFETVTSGKVLEQVVRSLDLAREFNLPNDRMAVARVRGMIRANARRGTDLIEISVTDLNRQRAADIANAVASAYLEVRRGLINRQNQQAIGVLDKQLQEQEERVRLARVRAHKAMKESKIVEAGMSYGRRGNADEVNTGETDIISRGRVGIFDLENKIDTLRAQISALQGLEGDELIRKAAMMGINEPNIQKYYPQFNDLVLQENQAEESGLGARHPQRRSIRRQIDSVKDILTKTVTDVRESLELQFKQAEAELKVAKNRTEDKEGDYIQNKLRYVTYQQARNDYETQRDILKELRVVSLTQRIEQTMPRMPLVIWEDAHPADFPSSPNKPLNLILGGVLGLIFGAGLAFMLEFMDTSVKSIEDVERHLGVPVLAVIPKDVGMLHKESGMSPDAEAYRILRTNIEFNRKSADANSITMISGGAGEGKSTTILNLAYVCAQGGYNTLVIDADLRRPVLHTHFEINNSVGLTNYLTTDLALEDVILQTPVDNLYFMPSGILPADAAGILNSRRMSELIADVKNRFDLVLLDSPPILGVSDASVLVSEADLSIVVIQHRKLPRAMLQRVKQAVENVGGTLLGVVLNNVDIRSDNQYQYYTSYYTYYAPSGRDSHKTEGGTPTTLSTKAGANEVARGDVNVEEDAF